ncbi:DUF1450 domain-containing protein [Marinitoga sp. 1155]|uniref:DUF1450 domain-containing protein n=1 Tax=Marinitoga sp. 1155 TaxID=1428448 RepID=UPI000641450A|nr:DUF1450 domain-containing protein [Marinitoga sp. 1155]KLO22441.1 hypothetical protein X274_08055 [Marinitoga sp. 1155]
MLQFCKNNNGVEKVVEYLEKKNIEYSIENCLDECAICHSKVFVKKDGEVISEDTVEELIKKI